MTQWTAESIKSLRLSLGFSRAQFASAIGCSVRAVSFWERGKRTPTGLYAKALEEQQTPEACSECGAIAWSGLVDGKCLYCVERMASAT